MPRNRIISVATGQITEIDIPPEEIAEREASAAKAAANQEVAATFNADTFVRNFIGMTPAQVSAYVNANTNNITEVRALLNKMALMLLYLARREYR